MDDTALNLETNRHLDQQFSPDLQRQRCIGLIMDELRGNWPKYREEIDPDNDFGEDVAAILADRDDDKLGRINDLFDVYLRNTAESVIDEPQYFGRWQELRYIAGLDQLEEAA